MSLSALPDTTPCWVDGYGQATLGEIRETLADTEDATLRMWAFIATHPETRPWKNSSGRTHAARKGSRV